MNKMHGKGCYITTDRVVKYGIWENGKIAKWDENPINNDEEKESPSKSCSPFRKSKT